MEEDNYCKNPHERCGALLICNTPFLCDARRHCLWVIQVDDSGLDLTIGLNNIVYAKLTKTKAFQRYVILFVWCIFVPALLAASNMLMPKSQRR